MAKILVVAQPTERMKYLSSMLSGRGFSCSFPSGDRADPASQDSPDIVLLLIAGQSARASMAELTVKPGRKTMLVALVERKSLERLNEMPEVDDFILEPWDEIELLVRVERLLYKNRQSGKTVRHGALLINLDKCTVELDGKPVELTFREYRLLVFLVSNPGKVFSRDALLNKVWGYDYFGGDRTVDVHIRRLRSKIEGSRNTFIETVRNIGYRINDLPQNITKT